MGRQTWIADALRKAGLKVVDVPGWRTRGSTSFEPIGVTWHATAGSRTMTAQIEVRVLIKGRPDRKPLRDRVRQRQPGRAGSRRPANDYHRRSFALAGGRE